MNRREEIARKFCLIR